MLTPRQAVAGSSGVHVRGLRGFLGLGEEERGRCVTEPVPVPAVLIQNPRLCLLDYSSNGGSRTTF